MNAVLDRPEDEVEEETTPVMAGFSSERAPKRTPQKPAPTEAEILEAMGLSPVKAGFRSYAPAANEAPAKPEAGSPVADIPADQPDFVPTQSSHEDLRQQLAAAWGQETIDDESFARVKDFVIHQVASADDSLIVADIESHDAIAVGTDSNGVQRVVGSSEITAAQALSRARIAATSEQFKTVGITEVHGTDKDKVLLCLAANFLGLKIKIQPLNIDPKILEEAKREWEILMATDRTARQAVPEAEPSTTPPATGLAEEIRDAAPDSTEQEIRNLVEDITPDIEIEEPASPDFADTVIEYRAGADLTTSKSTTLADEIRDASPDATEREIRNLVADITPDIEVEAPAVEKTVTEDFADTVIEARPLEALPDDGIPVLTEPPAPDELTTDEERALVKEIQIKNLKPEVKAILEGRNRNENINPEVYVELRERVKAGDKIFADADGFINKTGITNEFCERGIGTARTPRLIKALEADGIAYETTQPGAAHRTTVNYQVPSRPALRPE